MPEDGEYLWLWFWDMDSGRADGVNGPQPLSPRDIRDWSDMTCTIVTPDEVSIIRRMDVAYRSALAAEAADNQKRRDAEASRKP